MSRVTVRIFLSSTRLDLHVERREVENLVQQLTTACFADLEVEGSRPEIERRGAFEALERSQLYVGILGDRYGDGAVEIEYRRARSLDLRCLIYLRTTPNIPLEWRETDTEKAARLAAFKEELRRDQAVQEFRTPWGLQDRLQDVLQDWIRDAWVLPGLRVALDGPAPQVEVPEWVAAVRDLRMVPKELALELREKGFKVARPMGRPRTSARRRRLPVARGG